MLRRTYGDCDSTVEEARKQYRAGRHTSLYSNRTQSALKVSSHAARTLLANALLCPDLQNHPRHTRG